MHFDYVRSSEATGVYDVRRNITAFLLRQKTLVFTAP